MVYFCSWKNLTLLAMHFMHGNTCHIWRIFCKVEQVIESEQIYDRKITSNLQKITDVTHIPMHQCLFMVPSLRQPEILKKKEKS